MMNKIRVIFFFKQKTAYEITASDWSSDVCSSDLRNRRCRRHVPPRRGARRDRQSRRRRGSEERRVGKECRCCVDLGGGRIIKKKKKKEKIHYKVYIIINVYIKKIQKK